MEGNFEDILKKEYEKEAEEIRRSIVEREGADAEFAALEADASMKQEFVQMLRAKNAAAQTLHAEKPAAEVPYEENTAGAESDIAPEDAKLLAQMSEEAREAYRLGRKLLEKRAQGDYNCEMAEEIGYILLETISEEASDQSSMVSEEDTPKRAVRFRRKRVYLIVALVAILTMGLGMTSFGGKNYVMEMIDKIFPGKAQTTMDSEGENRKYSDREDNEAYAQINEELGINVVELLYVPKGCYFEMVDIDLEADRAYISYTGEKDTWIQYHIYANQSDQSISVYHDDKVLDEQQIIMSDTLINITEYQNPDGSVYYEASFIYENVNYQLLVNVEQTKFEKIVKNLFFY